MDERLLSIFRGEATERLDRMVQTLLAVEAGEGDSESIRELFRHAHSLKGTAGMVGLADIGTVAAAVEDVLSEARTSGELGPERAGPLLAVTDAIRGAMEGQPIDAAAIVAGLRGTEPKPPAAAAPGVPDPTPSPNRSRRARTARATASPRPGRRPSPPRCRPCAPCASPPIASTSCSTSPARR